MDLSGNGTLAYPWDVKSTPAIRVMVEFLAGAVVAAQPELKLRLTWNSTYLKVIPESEPRNTDFCIWPQKSACIVKVRLPDRPEYASLLAATGAELSPYNQQHGRQKMTFRPSVSEAVIRTLAALAGEIFSGQKGQDIRTVQPRRASHEAGASSAPGKSGPADFTILNYRCKSPEEVAAQVQALGKQMMRQNSHNFKLFGAIPIIDAAQRQIERVLSHDWYRNAAISLMTVVLAANRAYNKQVEPHVTRMRQTWPDLTLLELKEMIAARDYVQFKEIWGHADEKKFGLLRELVDVALALPSQPGWTDYDRMHAWASKASLENRLENPIGVIRNVGIATFQHLRMIFGIDTVKPDQRVTEVLDSEFGARLTPELSVLAVEEIAKYAGMRVVEIDQIFVKYGSGYYAK